ncbi:hypothetical protein ACJX0J_018343 [Zea mays]
MSGLITKKIHIAAQQYPKALQWICLGLKNGDGFALQDEIIFIKLNFILWKTKKMTYCLNAVLECIHIAVLDYCHMLWAACCAHQRGKKRNVFVIKEQKNVTKSK